jgi:thiamine pyrophosphate-dependent acetolactate synthase large subunit-like protein
MTLPGESPVTYDAVIGEIYDSIEDPVLIPNLGSNTAVAMAAKYVDSALYMWGGMGLTHSIGLGVAMARPERTVVILDGDGSVLMGLGGLATIGTERPRNLLHVVLDNAAWGNTGGQPTHTARGLRLEAVAAACGYPVTGRTSTVGEFRAAVGRFVREPDCTLILAPIEYVPVGRGPIPPDPVGIKQRFMSALTAP